MKTVSEILNVLDRSTERAILETIEEENVELAEEIKKLMFVFEDLILVDDRGMQNVLKEVDNKSLSLALKLASEELKGNSPRRAQRTTEVALSITLCLSVSSVVQFVASGSLNPSADPRSA